MMGLFLLGASLALAPVDAPAPTVAPGVVKSTTAPETAPGEAKKEPPREPPPPVKIAAPLLAPAAVPLAAPSLPSTSLPSDRWLVQREYQGTGPGVALDTNRVAFYGWLEGSYNASSRAKNNAPEVWDDRANSFLLEQGWFRFERTVVTSGTTAPTFGFRLDLLMGSDYRFTLPRGLWNSQLLNSTGSQNLYGVDLVQSYVEANFPTIGNGLDVKVGRFYSPFGTESVEAVSTPLLSRSYTFNFSPFTQVGVLATLTYNAIWTVQTAITNGNDVYIDPAEEARAFASVKWTQPGGRNVVTVAALLGRGKFNAGDPFVAATTATATEPAGRNNLNCIDVVWTHTVTPRVIYGLEAFYGYQTNVPANVPGGVIKEDADEGTAHSASLVHYLTLNWTPVFSNVFRVECFDDFEGQRTGYEGLYTALTAGAQFKLRRLASGNPQILFRPEIRWDHNGCSRPFEGDHDVFTTAADIILRW